MTFDKRQHFDDEFAQQIYEIYSQLSEVLKRNGLAEKVELEIRLNPITKSREASSRSEDLIEVSQNEDFREIFQSENFVEALLRSSYCFYDGQGFKCKRS